jgi:hypothetical protein
MALLSDFLPFFAHDVPAVPRPALENAVRQAAIEFCARTAAWNAKLPDLTLASIDLPHTFTPPTNARVHTILKCLVGNATVDPVTEDEADDKLGDWRGNTGIPSAFLLKLDNTFELVPYPNAETMVSMRVAYVPTNDATTLPDFLLEQHPYAIADGAMSRIARYAKPDLAAVAFGSFNTAIHNAAVNVSRDYAATTQSLRPNRIV